MARARNLKPSFFTNEELAEVPPLGRLLFQGLWCHADRAGRLEDRPKRLKAEVLPYDDCDVDALLGELQDKGFILRYSLGNARYIQVLKFAKHQNPHVKEADSIIPAPGQHCTSTVLAGPLMGCLNPQLGTGVELHAPDGAPPPDDPPLPNETQPAKKPREPNGARLEADWVCPQPWLEWAQHKRGWTAEYVLEVALLFRNHWTAKVGKDARKLDWHRTWQNWVLGQRAPPAQRSADVRDVRSRNMAILTGKTRHERAIEGTAERVGGATVLTLPSELREQGSDDVGGSGPERSAASVGG